MSPPDESPAWDDRGVSGSHAHARELTRWVWLSIAVALATMGMKFVAYLITGSVGLLSDALESVVNLVAAIIALAALTAATKPADEKHPYGHGKAEYLSAGAEGLMILFAAGAIIYAAVERLINPAPLEEIGLGLVITILAAVINGVVGVLLVRAGRRAHSITLVADGRHLLTDLYTSIGVVIGVALVGITGWLPLDSIVALLVALNIAWTGGILVRSAGRGLLDHALDAEHTRAIVTVLEEIAEEHPAGSVEFHGLQTRESGRDRFVALHVLVPGAWTMEQAHDLSEEVEARIGEVVPHVTVHVHLEAIEDPRAHGDFTSGPRIRRDPGAE
jgi:cation diffusion facilitator family transporter